LMGWMVIREKNIEHAVEIALANEANVTDFNGSIMSPWIRLPKGMSISRMLDRELFTVDIVVGHEGVWKGALKKERYDGRCVLAPEHASLALTVMVHGNVT
jgi:hypothetical protein